MRTPRSETAFEELDRWRRGPRAVLRLAVPSSWSKHSRAARSRACLGRPEPYGGERYRVLVVASASSISFLNLSHSLSSHASTFLMVSSSCPLVPLPFEPYFHRSSWANVKGGGVADGEEEGDEAEVRLVGEGSSAADLRASRSSVLGILERQLRCSIVVRRPTTFELEREQTGGQPEDWVGDAARQPQVSKAACGLSV